LAGVVARAPQHRRQWPRRPTDTLSIRSAADILGLSPSTVARRRQRQDTADAGDGMAPFRRLLGRDGKHRPSRRFDTTARDLRILALRHIGWSVRAIAGEVGCSVGTVHRVIKTGA
jgi:DNA-directed RNA polymerase specialized sigma24 family protein